jgi:hypothetical protein
MVGLGSLAVFLAVTGTARPQGYVVGDGRDSLTWPRVSVSVTHENGWVVAVGRAMDRSDRIVWRVPLVRGKGSAAIDYGLGTVFVRVGNAQFVIDSATGETIRLRPGEIWRQTWPPTSTQPPPQVTPKTPGGQAARNPGAANRQLIQALANFEYVLRLRRMGKASAEDVRLARTSVDLARQALRQAQVKTLKEAAPHPPVKVTPVATRPARELPERSPAVRSAESRVMDLAATYDRASLALEKMRRQKANATKVADAEARLAGLGKETEAAYAALRKLREAEMPSAVKANPQLRARIKQAEQNVDKRTETYDAAERDFLEVQKAYQGGRASAAKLAAAETALLKALEDMTAARRQLSDLVRPAARPAKP